ncbi:MAG: hypothetical protein WD226_01030 [Planctomycetota bacterium]
MNEPKSATDLAFSPYCRRLASKKLTFRTTPPQVDRDVLDAACNAWCTRTMDAIGPDGDLVGVDDCRADRECFLPYGPQA